MSDLPLWAERVAGLCRWVVDTMPVEVVQRQIALARETVERSDDPEEIGTARCLADMLEILAAGQDPTEYLLACEAELVEAEDWVGEQAVAEAERILAACDE